MLCHKQTDSLLSRPKPQKAYSWKSVIVQAWYFICFENHKMYQIHKVTHTQVYLANSILYLCTRNRFGCKFMLTFCGHLFYFLPQYSFVIKQYKIHHYPLTLSWLAITIAMQEVSKSSILYPREVSIISLEQEEESPTVILKKVGPLAQCIMWLKGIEAKIS